MFFMRRTRKAESYSKTGGRNFVSSRSKGTTHHVNFMRDIVVWRDLKKDQAKCKQEIGTVKHIYTDSIFFELASPCLFFLCAREAHTWEEDREEGFAETKKKSVWKTGWWFDLFFFFFFFFVQGSKERKKDTITHTHTSITHTISSFLTLIFTQPQSNFRTYLSRRFS